MWACIMLGRERENEIHVMESKTELTTIHGKWKKTNNKNFFTFFLLLNCRLEDNTIFNECKSDSSSAFRFFFFKKCKTNVKRMNSLLSEDHLEKFMGRYATKRECRKCFESTLHSWNWYRNTKKKSSVSFHISTISIYLRSDLKKRRKKWHFPWNSPFKGKKCLADFRFFFVQFSLDVHWLGVHKMIRISYEAATWWCRSVDVIEINFSPFSNIKCQRLNGE